MSVSKDLTKMKFLMVKTSTSTNMGHVGQPKHQENRISKGKDVDKDCALRAHDGAKL